MAHILEEVQRERDIIRDARQNWIETGVTIWQFGP
jgi:hypothetical protein